MEFISLEYLRRLGAMLSFVVGVLAAVRVIFIVCRHFVISKVRTSRSDDKKSIAGLVSCATVPSGCQRLSL